MTNFLSLPLELRQHILGYAFHNAAIHDVEFSLLQQELRSDSWMRKEFYPLLYRIAYAIVAPNIANLAMNLASIDLQLESDMIYPLNQTLTLFDDVITLQQDLTWSSIAKIDWAARLGVQTPNRTERQAWPTHMLHAKRCE